MTKERRGLWGVPRIYYEEDFSWAGSGLSYLLCWPRHVISECCLCNSPERKPMKCYKSISLHKALSSCLDGIIYILFSFNYVVFSFRYLSILKCKCINLVYLWLRQQLQILSQKMHLLDLALPLFRVLWASLSCFQEFRFLGGIIGGKSPSALKPLGSIIIAMNFAKHLLSLYFHGRKPEFLLKFCVQCWLLVILLKCLPYFEIMHNYSFPRTSLFQLWSSHAIPPHELSNSKQPPFIQEIMRCVTTLPKWE